MMTRTLGTDGEAAADIRVLIVDDDGEVRRALARSMKRHGIAFDLAQDGVEALKISLNRYYDVVITDLRMPRVDGLELIRNMRRTQSQASFILVTGATELNLSADPMLDGSMTSVIAKPWEDAELLDAVRRGAALSRQRRVKQGEDFALQRIRVLLVEDSEEDVVLIELMLGRFYGDRVQVEHVMRVGEAVQRLLDDPPQVVLTDLSLPDARGLDAVLRIQTVAGDVPIIVMSGLDDADVAMQALHLGAQDYIVKGKLASTDLETVLDHAMHRKHAEQRLVYLAHHDSLCGVTNRRGFRDKLTQALARSRRRCEPLGLLVLDIDRFKAINDTLGHETGDVVLQTIADRLQRCVREQDTVARLGGDEFAVIVEPPSGRSALATLMQRISDQLTQPIEVNTGELVAGASIGAAVFPDDGESIERLLSAADASMYAAKRSCQPDSGPCAGTPRENGAA